ncbi:ABC transporter permease [Streptomyces sp. NPDC059853]|uniref:ABC transporter permease n=1 Tax=Streptomyces sp. NPDC059853 TaxID=3346973 RepID=UPI003659C925
MSRSLGGLVPLSRTMVLGLVRDRTAVFFMLIFPLMFLLLFGALFQDTSVSRSPIAQVGDVELLEELPAEYRADLDEVVELRRAADLDEALKQVRDGDVAGAIWQDGTTIEVRYSEADGVRAGTVRSVVQTLVESANLAATGQPPTYTIAMDTVEDDSVKPIQFLAPGLLGWAVAMGGAFLSALTLVSMRKTRLLRRLWLAPVRPWAVVAGRVGVTLGLAVVQTALFLGVAVIPFYGLQLSGAWWLSIPLVLCGSLAFMSIGLIIGAVAKTEEAANGILQVTIMPMAFLSGSFFPTDAMPSWLTPIAQVLPLKHLNEALMAVLSRDDGWGTALPVMGGLLLFTAVCTAIAAKLFRWDSA